MVYERLSRFWEECKRVLRVTKKPDKQEYLMITKVAAIGILIIGGLGFILRMIETVTSLIIAASVVVVIVILLLMFKTE